jgi:hypothetical protein
MAKAQKATITTKDYARDVTRLLAEEEQGGLCDFDGLTTST